MKKSLLILLFAILSSMYTYAQESEIVWNQKIAQDGVKVYTAIKDCSNTTVDPTEIADPLTINEISEVILIKVENTSTANVKVSWNKELLKNKTVERSEITVTAGSSVSVEDCDETPEIQITSVEGDNKPMSVTEAESLLDFKIELTN